MTAEAPHVGCCPMLSSYMSSWKGVWCVLLCKKVCKWCATWWPTFRGPGTQSRCLTSNVASPGLAVQTPRHILRPSFASRNLCAWQWEERMKGCEGFFQVLGGFELFRSRVCWVGQPVGNGFAHIKPPNHLGEGGCVVDLELVQNLHPISWSYIFISWMKHLEWTYATYTFSQAKRERCMKITSYSVYRIYL